MRRTPTTLTLALALVATTFLIVAGSAAAQGLEDPLVAKVEDKAAQAQEDPAAYAGEQTSESQLADDANWTIAYTCFALHEASDEAGVAPPALDQCAGFEEALGIAEEAAADAEEEAVADVQELEDDAVAEAEVLAEDAVATVADVVEDPGNALDALTAFVDRAVRAVLRIVDALAAGLGDAGDLLSDALLGLGRLAATIVAAPFVGTYRLGLFLWDGGVAAATAMGDGINAAVAAIAAGASATTDAIADGATGTWNTLADAAGAVTNAVRDLLGGGPGPATPDQPTLPDEQTRPVTDTTNGLLDTVTGALDP